MIIGICGKSGSGKSTLSREIIELSHNKVVHLDIDKIGHKVLLLPEVKNELINSFGKTILEDNIVEYVEATDIGLHSSDDLYKKPIETVVVSVKQIVDIEGPIHVKEVTKRIRDSWHLGALRLNKQKVNIAFLWMQMIC